jgi:UDP-N-acetylglucosamine 2-epimerase (non-hydrolysing)
MPRAVKIAVVLGTRPEIIKLASVIRDLGDQAEVVNTGQHYDADMSGVFLKQLGIPEPTYNLGIGGKTRGAQIARGLEVMETLFRASNPAAVIVQGDTNSTLAGALAANALGIRLVHVEAGLRSYDRAMPEEHNRVLVDHLSHFLAAGTSGNLTNLVREGIDASSVDVTGNTVVEAVYAALPDEASRQQVLADLRLTPDRFVLATIHRPENTDDPDQLSATLTELGQLGIPVVFPVHPRTRAAIERHGLEALLERFVTTPPLDYQSFLGLAAHAAVIVSDSGGVQEEVTVLKRPLVVVRRSTERPESLEHFARIVLPGPEVGEAARAVIEDAQLLDVLATIPSPFGDGRASQRIVERIRALVA